MPKDTGKDLNDRIDGEDGLLYGGTGGRGVHNRLLWHIRSSGYYRRRAHSCPKGGRAEAHAKANGIISGRQGKTTWLLSQENINMTDIGNSDSLPCTPAGDRRLVESGPTSVKWTTGHVLVSNPVSRAKCVTERNPNKLQLRETIDFATWNVRGLLQPGKLHIVENKMTRLNIDICGVTETHWKDKGHFSL